MHMPSHIYVRVGQYDKAIDNNVRSMQVDQQFAKIWGERPLPNLGTYPLSHKMHAGHALDFIRYAATVQGNYKTASDAAWRMANRIKSSAVRVRGGQKRASAPWLVLKIFGKWDELLSLTPAHQGTPYLDGIWSYSVGSAYPGKGNLSAARNELGKLQTIANAPNADEYRVGATPASAVLKLAAFGLEGEVLMAQGDVQGAIRAFQAGVAMKIKTTTQSLRIGPSPCVITWVQRCSKPHNQRPPRPFIAATCAGIRNNGWALFGLHQALVAQGKSSEAEQIYGEWQTAWTYADVELTASHL